MKKRKKLSFAFGVGLAMAAILGVDSDKAYEVKENKKVKKIRIICDLEHIE